MPGPRTRLTSSSTRRSPKRLATCSATTSRFVRRSVALKSMAAVRSLLPACTLASSSISRPASWMRACDFVVRAFGPSAQPVDLAPYAVGERLLPVRLLAQRRVLPLEELAVAAARLEEAAGVDGIEVEHAPRRRARGTSDRG